MSKPKKWDTMTPEEQAEWKEKRREYHREYCRRKYAENPEKIKAYLLEWRILNNGKKAEYNRKWRTQNRQKDSEYHRKWRSANRDMCREYESKYRSSNKDKIRTRNAKQCAELKISYVARKLQIPTALVKKNMDIYEAKCDQIKILRELKPKRTKHNAQEPK